MTPFCYGEASRGADVFGDPELEIMLSPDDFPEGYEAREELGEGSMGTVWLAYSHRARGHCAVKVLSLKGDRKGTADRSFNREVRAMARLSHPSVVGIYDYGRTANDSPFVAMEYVPGESLTRFVREPWSWPRLWTFIDLLLGGLAHAHARDLVHRDLKPGNVLLVPGVLGAESLKLVDFGIALAVHDARVAGRRIEGTPAYIAPEAAKGEIAAIGPWTDLYSLGVMLFEILTGELPFHGRHLLTHHQRTPVPPIALRPDVDAPPGLVPIVAKLLEKSPVHRFRSVADLRAALDALGPRPDPTEFESPDDLLSMDEPLSNIGSPIVPVREPCGPGLLHLREPPIAGREEARQILLEAAHGVLAGHGPRVVLIEGEPGIGKSRLAGHLREWLEETGRMPALVIRSEPHVRSGGGLRQSFLRYLGAPDAVRTEADDILAAVFPEAEARQNAIDALWGPSGGEQTNDEIQTARAARMIRDFVGERPFLIWADDAQWSPEGRVLRLVHRLAQADGPPRLLMLVTLRPSQRTTVQAARQALLALKGTDHLRLAPLRPNDLAPALEALAPLPPGLAEAACMQAAGNPLIALEALRGFLEEEGVSRAPSDPNAVLQTRIDGATRGPGGGDLRSTLARATLLGRSFTLRPLLRLCGVDGDPEAPELPQDPEVVEAMLERAVSAGLIVEQGEGRWRFNHDLVRNQFKSVCRQLRNWPELNLAAAELKLARAQQDQTGIELEVVARHHAEAGEMERALGLGQESLRRLHGAGLMGHAVSFTRRVLEWDDRTRLLTPEQRAEIHFIGSEAAEHAGQPDEAEHHAQEALEIAKRNELAGVGSRAASRLGLLRLHDDEPEAAEHWLWDALKFARKSGDPRARCLAHLTLGQLYQHLGRLDQALMAFEASLESARTEGLFAEALAARTALAQLDRLEGQIERAEQAFTRIAQEADEAGREVTATVARLQIGLCAWNRGDTRAAMAAFEEAHGHARGNLFAVEFYACLGQAWALCAEGRWSEAEMRLLQAEDLRYDVRLHDNEAERLRRTIRELAVAARKYDVVERVDKLDVLVTRTHSTTGHTRSR